MYCWQDDFPLASLPLLGYSVSSPSEADNIHKDYVVKLQFKNHVYFFRAESQYTFDRSVHRWQVSTPLTSQRTVDRSVHIWQVNAPLTGQYNIDTFNTAHSYMYWYNHVHVHVHVNVHVHVCQLTLTLALPLIIAATTGGWNPLGELHAQNPSAGRQIGFADR